MNSILRLPSTAEIFPVAAERIDCGIGGTPSSTPVKVGGTGQGTSTAGSTNSHPAWAMIGTVTLVDADEVAAAALSKAKASLFTACTNCSMSSLETGLLIHGIQQGEPSSPDARGEPAPPSPPAKVGWPGRRRFATDTAKNQGRQEELQCKGQERRKLRSERVVKASANLANLSNMP